MVEASWSEIPDAEQTLHMRFLSTGERRVSNTYPDMPSLSSSSTLISNLEVLERSASDRMLESARAVTSSFRELDAGRVRENPLPACPTSCKMTD